MEFIHALETIPALLYATAGFVGLCVGSFLNVVIYRLPRMMEAQWRAECAALAAEAGGPAAEAPAAEPFNLLRPASRPTYRGRMSPCPIVRGPCRLQRPACGGWEHRGGFHRRAGIAA